MFSACTLVQVRGLKKRKEAADDEAKLAWSRETRGSCKRMIGGLLFESHEGKKTYENAKALHTS